MKKVLVGMSGGVDSSVAAFLLQKMGYEVVGLHFTLTGERGNLDDLDAVCKRLGVKYYVADFSEVFQKNVFKPFLNEYAIGNTPNICVLCNEYIKFGALFDKAEELGCDFVATGHYCSIIEKDGRKCLAKAKDANKDQTYFLNRVSEDVLKKTLFPLYGYTKDEVRKIATENEIPTAQKKDSSDVCLAAGRKFVDFIADYMPDAKGDIVTDRGEKVGVHKGLFRYTLGQRKGLDLGGKSGEDGRWFVIKKDGVSNRLIVSHGDESALFCKTFTVDNLNFITEPFDNPFKCMVKTRYRATEKPALVTVTGDKAVVVLDESERAVTIGQYAVFYADGICLGGGRIASVED